MFNYEDGSCDCGGHAVKRHNKKDGSVFWGCSNFPKCKNTEPYPNYASKFFKGDGLFSSEDEMECWAEAMTYDCGFK